MIRFWESSFDLIIKMSNVNGQLDYILARMPKLGSACKDFCQRAQEINQRRLKNRNTLNYHTQLLELLEIPQLMDTCVRNSFYEEALELEAYTQKLRRLHPDVPIIQSIVRHSISIPLISTRQKKFEPLPTWCSSNCISNWDPTSNFPYVSESSDISNVSEFIRNENFA